jgi:predicted PurR-regulated permease PerM
MVKPWSKSTKYGVVVTVGLSLILLLWFIRPLLPALIIAGLLAYTLNPLVSYLSRRTHLSRGIAVNIVFILMLAILITTPALLVPRLLRQAQSLTEQIQIGLVEARAFFREPVSVGGFEFSLDQFLANAAASLGDTVGSLAANLFALLLGATSSLLWVLVTVVSTYYLLRDGRRLLAWLIAMAPPGYEDHARVLLSEINLVWSAFLRGQLLLMALIALMTWLGTVAVGLPGGLALGILAGVLDVIPSLGPTVAAVPAVLVAIVQGSSYLPVSNAWFALLVAIVYLTVQQIENIWLRPRIMGHSLNLHPGVIFVAVIGALALVGILGALIVVPLLASAGIIGRYLRAMLTGQPPFGSGEAPVPSPAAAETPRRERDRTPTLTP